MINKAVKNEELYKLEKGFYSDKPHEPEISLISLKYPEAVFTMNNAFYYHNLTGTIPDKYFLVTDKNAATITDKRIVQKYENSTALKLGVIQMEQDKGLIKSTVKKGCCLNSYETRTICRLITTRKL